MSKLKPKLFAYQKGTDEKWLYVHFYDDTVWLTIEQIAELFDSTPTVVLELLDKMYEHKSLKEDRVSTYFSINDIESSGYKDRLENQKYYNLDAILAIGYILNADRANIFRKWVGTDMNNNESKIIERKVFQVYIWQIVLKFIVAVILAYFIGVILRKETQLSNAMSYMIVVLTFLMAMYDTVFDAMRYSITHGFWKVKKD